MSAIKEQMIKIITEQPDDSSYKEILQELSFTAMVTKGLHDSQNGRITSTTDLNEEINNW